MAQSSRFFKIDDDVLMEFIYHDQSNPVEIETDDNGSEIMFLQTELGNSLASMHLLCELGSDVVNFDVTQSGSRLAIENFASRTLLLESNKSYKFNLEDLDDPNLFTISSNVSTSIGILSVSGSIATFIPTRNTIQGETVEYGYPGLIGGKIIVSEKSNPLFATPDEDTGNSIDQVKGRYHAVSYPGTENMYFLLGYDSTGAYDKYNFINNFPNWAGSTEADLLDSQTFLTTTTNVVRYDTIRLHLRSGSSFAARNYEGFMFDVAVDRENGVKNYLTQLVYLNQSNYEISNPKPFVLSEVLYNRFIEVKIPTLVNQDPIFETYFYPNVAVPDGLNGTNISSTVNYEVSFRLIDRLTTSAGFDYFYTGEENTFIVSREDEFSSFSVNVEDAADGDYFNIYGMYDGSSSKFAAWVLNQINTTSDDITVFFDIEIYEQIGASNIKTFEANFTKNEDFDTPIIFRPIIKNANIAVNFSIDVDMRIYNLTDNTQIVKKASATFNQAAKYGKKMQNLTINSANKTTEVYNILPNLSVNRAIRGLITGSTPQSVKYVPTFIERYNIVAAPTQVDLLTSTSINEFEALIEDLDSPEFQNAGAAVIVVPPFTTYYKFVIAKKRGDDVEFVDFTSANELVLSFSDGTNTKSFRDISNKNLNMAKGELLFKIDESNIQAIRGMQAQNFYISIDNGNGTSTMVTYGKFTLA